MVYTARFAEQWEVVDLLVGDAVAANTESNTGYIDCSAYQRVAVVIIPVDVNDALDVDIEEGTSSAGAGAQSFDSGGKDVTIATTDDAVTIIEIRPEEFTVASGYRYLNVEVTTANTGNGSNEFAVLVLGAPKYAPAATTNIEELSD